MLIAVGSAWAQNVNVTFTANGTVKVIEISEGTYIRLGSYNGEYVDWFAARSNSNGWVMLSKMAWS